MIKTWLLASTALAAAATAAPADDPRPAHAGQRVTCSVSVYLPFSTPFADVPVTSLFAGEGPSECGGRVPGKLRVDGELEGNCAAHHATGTYHLRDLALPLRGHRAEGSFQNTRLLVQTVMATVEDEFVGVASFEVERHPANACTPGPGGRLVPVEAATISGSIEVVLR